MSEVKLSKAEDSAVTGSTSEPEEPKDQSVPFYPPLIGGMFAPQYSDTVSSGNYIIGTEW
jgi:hypothetical protein